MSTEELHAELPPFLEELSRRAILTDGAMATMIYQKGVYINQSFENLNIDRPHLVKNIHLEYLRAGAELLRANTFCAHALKLAKYGLGDKVKEINLAGVRLAKEAAAGRAWVAGLVGPPGAEVEGDFNAASSDRLTAVYTEQIAHLLEGGVDAIFFESFNHLPTLALAVEAAKNLDAAIPCVAMVHLETGLKTRFGDDPSAIGAALDAMRAEVVGFNDGAGPAVLNEALEHLRFLTAKPLALLPGAGAPILHEDRYLNMATPEYFMELLRKGMVKGARLLGGSSGCHPEHIKAIQGSIKMLQPLRSSGSVKVSAITGGESNAQREDFSMLEFPTPSNFAAKLRAGKFVVSIEIDPPIGTDATKSLEAAAVCRDAGIDAINIADGPRATARMGPIDMAMLLRDHVRGIEPIVHFCCRDRNLLGMQADLIGANALGIFNILMITGDPPKLGDYPFATAVYDVDAIGALKIASNLNSGKDLAGNPLKGSPTKLFLGAGANPGAIDLDHEIRRLEQKVEAGANYILTQPVYDLALYEKFHARIAHLKVPLLLGILPLASFKNAEFLTKEVPGMHVPEPIRERLRLCPDKESARLCGIDVAREALRDALPTIQGTYVMPPFNRVDSALAVLEVAKERMEG
ncbi:bifunctional homocysteine S-methyltransferase/methylenetetrahydrofolate reductase [soil metagenome]